ncbi:M23 family metallopeptidase [Helicobacter muridarum]|uniref:M23 family metallopeptidase n=1 Tax=Helicobacter muridarum TaxID=216 RepID=A0A377PY05_9HELI|nr:peptidoglycan DD-metalloendopeptidase family protein [Helicobacter muridarum]TLD98903.1 M23 family metallopeptidase [Helicobacter muridarum]STQ87131.1 M23/M37 family peptidase [Helicobacter muridarum]
MRISFLAVCYFAFCALLFAGDIYNAGVQKRFYASYAERAKWEYGFTLLGFLAKNNIPESTYYSLSPEDKELVADVKTDSEIFIVRDSNGNLLQAFLPLNAETQVKIFFDFKENLYKMNIIPIISLETKQRVMARIQSGGSPSSALYSATKDPRLNQEFLMAYRSRQIVQKGDRIAVIYYRKYRLGKPIGLPTIESIAVESQGRFSYLFGFQNRYRDEDGKEMASFLLINPVKYRRISSKFSSGRRHPVLGYVRPHYGVDFSAPTGTKIYAAGDGRIIFAGVKGGYGKVIEIQHDGGIKTLYAHMSKIGKASKPGAFVRQGTYIGDVGSTGLSTGPHLHFGVYKNNMPIDPLGQIKTERSELSGSTKKAFMEFTSNAKQEIKSFIANTVIPDDTNSVVVRTLIGVNDSQSLQDEGEDEVNIDTSNGAVE